MYVLHAMFTEAGSWELWAEDSGRPLTVPGGRKAGQAKAGPAKTEPVQPGRAQRHPFAADPADVARLLATAGEEAAAAVRTADPRGSVPLALPSNARGPAPSAQLLPFLDRDPGGGPLRAWIVPTLVLDPADGAALLAAIGGERLAVYGPDDAETDMPLADSVRFAAAVARFAEALVRRGAVRPGLDRDTGDDDGRDDGDRAASDDARERVFHAVWHPDYTLEGAAHRKALIEAMPPIMRAQLLGAELDGRPAADVFDEAVGGLVDAHVLAALAAPGALRGADLLPDRSRRAAAVPRTAAARWLLALTSPQGNQLDEDGLDPRDVDRLFEALQRWRTAPASDGAVRTCFRLVEPAPGAGPGAAGDTNADSLDDGEWTVELLLQSVDDPSLLAAADEVWKRTGAARLLHDAGIDPRQSLLSGLGRAQRLFPALRLALAEPAPTRVVLDTQGAYQFLSRSAPALGEAGFGVLLPGWWSAGRAELGLTLAASPPTEQPGRVATGAAGFSLDSIVDYEWRASIGGQQLSETEFQALAEAKSGLVRLRGRWVEVDADRLAGALKRLRDGQSGVVRAGDFLRTALFGLDDASEDLPFETVEAEGWLGDLLSGVAEQRCEPVPAPPGLNAVLRPYQERGVGWLGFMERVGLGAVLADSMGLGKTVQVLALLEAQRGAEAAAGATGETVAPNTADTHDGLDRLDSTNTSGVVRPTLLICPMSLVANWQREAARFTPKLRVHVHHGAERLSGDEFRAAVAGAHLVVTTYGLALRDRAELAALDWHRVVVDEAQAIKNAATKQARAVRSLPAPHRIALTGTPVENRLADLWAILEFANPGLLGSAESFKDRFARPIERDGDANAAARLRRATGAFVLRREKTDPAIISDLPEKVEMKILCNLTKEQASLYQAVVDDALAALRGAEGIARHGQVLALLTRLKQICNHPAHFLKDGSRLPGRSGKLARVEEICDEVLAAGEKALLFTQYAEFGGMLQRHLAERFGREVAFLYGGAQKKARDAMVQRFETPDGPPLFVLSLKAGGVGLNLTAANHVLHVDRWWNPAVEDQATDRAFRIGQRRNVQVRKLMCAGTLEERIDKVIEDKKELAESIVGTGESWLTELSVAELREVVLLAADAVVE